MRGAPLVGLGLLLFACAPPPRSPDPAPAAPVTAPAPALVPAPAVAPPPVAPLVTVAVGNPRFVGAVDADDAVHVVFNKGPALAACATGTDVGLVTVKLTVKGDGSVGNAVVVNSALNNGVVEHCLLTAMRDWRFARPRGGLAVIEVPLTFQRP